MRTTDHDAKCMRRPHATHMATRWALATSLVTACTLAACSGSDPVRDPVVNLPGASDAAPDRARADVGEPDAEATVDALADAGPEDASDASDPADADYFPGCQRDPMRDARCPASVHPAIPHAVLCDEPSPAPDAPPVAAGCQYQSGGGTPFWCCP